jgi:hypothetical protein
MSFPAKKVINIAERLKEHPNEIWICSEYMAVWSEMLNRAIILRGDYLHLTDKELNLVLQEKIETVLI